MNRLREKTTATLLIAIFMMSMFTVGVQAMHFLGMNGGSLSVISEFGEEPEETVLGDVVFDAQSDLVTIEGTISDLDVFSGDWPHVAYLEIGVRPEATKEETNAGIYMIVLGSSKAGIFAIHLQDYGGQRPGDPPWPAYIPVGKADKIDYEITLIPSGEYGGTAYLDLWDMDGTHYEAPSQVYGYSSEGATTPDEDFSEARLFYSLMAEGLGNSGITYSATIGDLTTNILLPHPEVWVDDDYHDGGYNDGHVWDIDAFDTIQEGVDVVDEGGTVYVAAGLYEPASNYADAVKIMDKSLTLLGAQADVPIVDGEREGEESIIRGKTYSWYPYKPRTFCLVRIQNSDVVINGFTIEGAKQWNVAITGSSIRHEGISDILVSYNYIKESGYDAIFRDSGAAYVTIDHNHIASNSRGIATNGGGTNITDNTFYHNGQGITFNGGDPYSVYFPDYDEPFYPTIISGNTFTDDSTSMYLRLDKCHQSITITGNDITEARKDAIRTWNVYDVDLVNPAIHYNNIVGSTNFGIDNQVSEINLNATLNWWGHASGPSGEDGRTNPAGKVIGRGDAVSNVNWDPCLPQPVLHTKHDPVPSGLE